jgi:energy-coupling factor transporter transmembrane protein EcfT
MRLVEREKIINARLSRYMEFWKQGMEQNATYVMKMIIIDLFVKTITLF